jgi:hypothetical protein
MITTPLPAKDMIYVDDDVAYFIHNSIQQVDGVPKAVPDLWTLCKKSSASIPMRMQRTEGSYCPFTDEAFSGLFSKGDKAIPEFAKSGDRLIGRVKCNGVSSPFIFINMKTGVYSCLYNSGISVDGFVCGIDNETFHYVDKKRNKLYICSVMVEELETESDQIRVVRTNITDQIRGILDQMVARRLPNLPVRTTTAADSVIDGTLLKHPDMMEGMYAFVYKHGGLIFVNYSCSSFYYLPMETPYRVARLNRDVLYSNLPGSISRLTMVSFGVQIMDDEGNVNTCVHTLKNSYSTDSDVASKEVLSIVHEGTTMKMWYEDDGIIKTVSQEKTSKSTQV